MGEYLKRDSILSILESMKAEPPITENSQFYNAAIEHLRKCVAALPGTDAVEAVRCKDCCFSAGFEDDASAGRCGKWWLIVTGDDFCSRGDRRE